MYTKTRAFVLGGHKRKEERNLFIYVVPESRSPEAVGHKRE
jgi:hypothetical protein